MARVADAERPTVYFAIRDRCDEAEVGDRADIPIDPHTRPPDEEIEAQRRLAGRSSSRWIVSRRSNGR